MNERFISAKLSEFPKGWSKNLRTNLKIVVTPVDQLGVNPDDIDDTTWHESEHISPDPDNVQWATNQSGDGFLGLTVLRRHSIIQAAAPHANGRRGTGFDLATIEARRHDLNSAISEAGKVINQLKRRTLFIAARLYRQGYITGAEAKQASTESEYDKAKMVIEEDGKQKSVTSTVKIGEQHVFNVDVKEEKPEINQDNISRPFEEKIKNTIYSNTNRLVITMAA